MGKVKDLTGQRFGKLVVLREGNRLLDGSVGTSHKARWICRCDCGNETIVLTDNLQAGNTRSCGCYGAEMRRGRRRVWHEKSKIRKSPWEQRKAKS